LLGNFNAKVGIEDTLKPTIGNVSLHGTSFDNVVQIVNVATSKTLIFKSKMSPYGKIYKCTRTSPDGKIHN
jgi:hypothetical protein